MNFPEDDDGDINKCLHGSLELSLSFKNCVVFSKSSFSVSTQPVLRYFCMCHEFAKHMIGVRVKVRGRIS
jgi:hypothetical protein